jgi:quercetin dioxygenase-like cupin family protein
MSMTKLKMLLGEAVQSLEGVPSTRDNGFTHYDLRQGNAMAFKVLRKSGIAVADSFMSSGTIFPYHKHSACKETFHVYEGQISLITEDEDDPIVLKSGDTYTIKCSEGHLLIAKKDTWIVAVTMPADKQFPG